MKVLCPINDNQDVTNKSFVDASSVNLIDIIYPVGTIYTTTSSTFNPATAWGGTWEQLTSDAYLKIVTSNAGTVAGTTDHKIAITNMPSHTHTFTGSSATTASQSTSTTGNQSANHTHSGTTAANNRGHTHGYWVAPKWTTQRGTSGGIDISDEPGAGLSYGSTTGGESQNHTHTITTGNQSASHNHSFSHTHTLTAAGSNSNTGGGTAYYPGYYGVYAWHRTA